MDLTTTFLNGDLKEEVYMRQPEGFIAKGQEHLFCCLRMGSSKHLGAGTRCWNQMLEPGAGTRCWNQVLDSQLKF